MADDENVHIYTLDELKSAVQHFTLKKSGAFYNLCDPQTPNQIGIQIILENVELERYFEVDNGRKQKMKFSSNNRNLLISLSERSDFHKKMLQLLHEEKSSAKQIMPFVHQSYGFSTKAAYCMQHNSLNDIPCFDENNGIEYHDHVNDGPDTIHPSKLGDYNLDVLIKISGIFVPDSNQMGFIISSLSQAKFKERLLANTSRRLLAPVIPLSNINRNNNHDNNDNNNSASRNQNCSSCQGTGFVQSAINRNIRVPCVQCVIFHAFNPNQNSDISANNQREELKKDFTPEELEQQAKLLAEFESKQQKKTKRKLEEIEKLKSSSEEKQPKLEDNEIIKELVKQGFQEELVKKMSPEVFAPLRLMIEKQLHWQQNLEAESAKLAEEKQQLEDELLRNKCKCCYESDIEIIFFPCNHIAVCENCSKQLKQCLICRNPIARRQKCYTN